MSTAHVRMVVLVLLLAVVGCDRGSQEKPSNSTADVGAQKAAKKRVVAVIPKGTTHEFWKSIHAGANKAGKELDVEILWQGPVREDDRAEQVRVMEDVISRGVAGIVLAPLDDKALVPVSKEATREKIPVVIIDSGIKWDGLVSFVATDNFVGGQMAAKRLGGLLAEGDKVLMMRYQEGSASTMQREKGFLETMKKDFPKIELVSTNQYGGATTESAYSTAENLLVNFPEVKGIFCPNESTTFGMLRALRDAKKAGTIKFVGFDSSEKLVEGLEKDHIHGLVLQNPFKMGELGVKTIVSHLDGKKVDKRLDTGVTMVTKENMNKPEIRSVLVPDLSKWLD